MTDKDIAGLREQIRGALARGYCHTNNSRKVLDGDLIVAMETEVMTVLAQALAAALASPAGELEPKTAIEVIRDGLAVMKNGSPREDAKKWVIEAEQTLAGLIETPPSAPPATFTRVWGDVQDHMGEHNENSFCRKSGCKPAPTDQEQLAQWMIAHSFATGHGDKFADLLNELSWQVAELREAGRQAGIEEIAKYFEVSEEPDLAREIRRRATAKPPNLDLREEGDVKNDDTY